MASWTQQEDVARLRAHTTTHPMWQLLDDPRPQNYLDFARLFWSWLCKITAEAANRTGLPLLPTTAYNDQFTDAELPEDALAPPFFGSLAYLATKRHLRRLGYSQYVDQPYKREFLPVLPYFSKGKYVYARLVVPLGALSHTRLANSVTRFVNNSLLKRKEDPDLYWTVPGVAEKDLLEGIIVCTIARCRDQEKQYEIFRVHGEMARNFGDDPLTIRVCESWAVLVNQWKEFIEMLRSLKLEDVASGFCDACPDKAEAAPSVKGP